MAADLNTMPWLSAWLEASRMLGAEALHPAGRDAAARLAAFGGDYAGLASDYFRSIGSPLGLDAVRADLIERYRRLFMPEAGVTGTATSARCLAALQKSGEFAAEIAIDAFKRLSADLANPDPAIPPVTSLKALHELWIECGEAAYAAAAHREDFADAQAELLAALVELRSGQAR